MDLNISSITIFVNQTALGRDATGSSVCGFEGIYGAGPYSGDTNIIPPVVVVDDDNNLFFFCSFINNCQTSICSFLSVSHSTADGSDICGPCAKPNRAWIYSHRLDTNVNTFGHHLSLSSSFELKTLSHEQYQCDKSAFNFRYFDCAIDGMDNISRV
jgi:hypothetical protein